jgi:putative hydrolase
MTNEPDKRPDEPDDDPLSGLFRALGGAGGQLPPGFPALPGMPSDPQALQAMLAQVQQMLAGGGDGPVNWDLAMDVARQAAAEGGDPTVSEADQRAVAEALRTADLWLDRASDLPSAAARTQAWSRAEWLTRTLPTWRGIVEPIATSVGDAMGAAMAAQAPPELGPMLSGVLPMMRRMGGAFFGSQLGQGLGALSREVVGAGEIGLPLLPAGQAALVPANIAEFGAGLDLPADEVRLYLALREAAHARLVAGVPWLRAHLLGAVEEYARGITIDTDRIEEAVRQIDPSDPESMQQALSSGLFEPERTPQQQAALDRLETALALVEGWVDATVDSAARGSLPHAAALRETVRRRRAAGGPAEQTFAALVGLELRPRRLREAAAVWEALAAARGTAGRDALWAHPDLLPGPEAFADPEGFARQGELESMGTDEFDAALERLLDDEQARGEGEQSSGTGDASSGTGGASPAGEQSGDACDEGPQPPAGGSGQG